MADGLEVIKEEQNTPALSCMDVSEDLEVEKEVAAVEPCKCCKVRLPEVRDDTEKIEELLREQEEKLKKEFEKELERDISFLKERFDYILQNEQVRASYLLREAHRERQEKISALQTQLECKNLAGLMYVMCTERRKSKLEKLRIIEEYSNYIYALQDILTEAQDLILHLSRGYKTASRVDHEWREKMTKIITEFQAYIYHFCGGTPESNQYFFNLPKLLKTTAPLEDNPQEDPCEAEEDVLEEASAVSDGGNLWWERVEGDCRPFIMFGDMADFKPPQRREVLKAVKAAKTAPKKWKEYVFNEMFLKKECSNTDAIKDKYMERLPVGGKWECSAMQNHDTSSKASLVNRRATRQSVEIRGNMGSILKIITSQATQQPVTKATLLGARDSMEIASTTRLREKKRQSEHSKVVINVRSRRESLFDQFNEKDFNDDYFSESINSPSKSEDEDTDETLSPLGSNHNDSLTIIPGHVPDQDHKINYEKICPMEKCQRLQVDSFVKSLPSYMRANPFTHFEKTFEEYETCTPEQIEILKQRIDEKMKKEKVVSNVTEESPLAEWVPSVEGIAVQTSAMSFDLPPCTCYAPSPTPASSYGNIFRVDDLIPTKLALDKINKDCLHDRRIEFNRFKVIGMESKNSLESETKTDFKQTRVQEITKILQQHPSLLDIFQANTRC